MKTEEASRAELAESGWWGCALWSSRRGEGIKMAGEAENKRGGPRRARRICSLPSSLLQLSAESVHMWAGDPAKSGGWWRWYGDGGEPIPCGAAVPVLWLLLYSLVSSFLYQDWLVSWWRTGVEISLVNDASQLF